MQYLPEEKIDEICKYMDTESLINFTKTSKDNKRICEPVLHKRIQSYYKLIDEVFDILRELDLEAGDTYYITLFSDGDTYFNLERFNTGSSILMLKITETIKEDIKFFKLQKLSLVTDQPEIEYNFYKLGIHQEAKAREVFLNY